MTITEALHGEVAGRQAACSWGPARGRGCLSGYPGAQPQDWEDQGNQTHTSCPPGARTSARRMRSKPEATKE